MAARAIWKAVIRLGDEAVPVKLYSAIEDRSVHFRLLHESDLVPVEQRMIHPVTEAHVPYDDVRRGVETERGMVVLDEDEVESLEPEKSRDIEVLRFVPEPEIDHRWYLRPYWLGPDESGPAYAALIEALTGRDLEGVARWSMRNKDYRGALRIRDGRLMLVTLRPAAEVVGVEELDPPGGRELAGPEAEMAVRLIDALAGDWDPGAWEDEYRARVLELVDAKASGKVVAFEPVKKEASKGSLAEALEASLERAKEKASA